MLAALATLAFAATIWGIAVVAASLLEERGAKIRSALRGQALAVDGLAANAVGISPRAPVRAPHPLPARPTLRAAA